jgi:glucosamine kinase
MTEKLFLGVDGGASRCRARLETADGRVIGRGVSGPASMRFGLETVKRSVLDAARQTLAEAGLSDDAFKRTYAGVGLAGTGQPGARDELESWRHPFADAWFEGDGYLALLGAFGGHDGGIVIVGTGSIAIAYQDKTVRIGGYGFPVSDEGSGADLGLNALRHALRTLDGRAEPSAFSQAVLAKFPGGPSEVAGWIERAVSTDYATLAPLVVDYAAQGDSTARRLMEQAGAQIAQLIEALFARGVARVALSGGLAAPIRRYLPPEIAARLVAPLSDATSGGVLLARTKASQTDRAAGAQA